MEVLKSVWRSPAAFRKRSKHTRVPEEQWGQAKEPIIDGVGFHLKYIGSTLVEELPEGQSYGDRVSSDAVKTIVTMAKSKGNKLDKASLKISSKRIEVIDLTRDYTITKVSIHRISFCTADKHYDKVFAFIVRNTENETMECHAFMCDNRKMAHAVTLTVARAFSVANESEQEENECNRESLHTSSNTSSPVFQPSNPVKINSSLASSPTSSPCSFDQSPSSSTRSLSSPFTIQTLQPTDNRQIEEEFDLADSFSQLAQMRCHAGDPGF